MTFAQGGPHNHIIAAVATALKEANTDEFREYQRQVIIAPTPLWRHEKGAGLYNSKWIFTKFSTEDNTYSGSSELQGALCISTKQRLQGGIRRHR